MSVYEGDSLSMSFWDARAAVRIFSPSKPNDVKFIVFMVWEEFARLVPGPPCGPAAGPVAACIVWHQLRPVLVDCGPMV
jgi:hypothetical protein